ncbi:Gfo/Idh/MocA family oxidoreductase [Microbacterium mitrae]|uniref:Gfo/Idh/MocA family oxidoreductase n=1 Tax=Microbacterium mitrae TaxID=664640 RepID=A0A5C8HND6_9MICO|nr:Gfo/Idh/MocA family oxidoreductase [Microbacterium mitrae]TXK04529.1 Gfo/Idh/MocA family oxidoreductase [Microbacterium mitrae]
MTAPRWGILGPGGIANAFVKDLRTAGLTIEAVASRSIERAQTFADTYEIPRAHGSYLALAQDPDVDIVYIATTHPQHVAPALLMLEHGKHVLIEKAITANAHEAQLIADAAARHGRLALEAMWTRYLPHMARIREIIAAGTLGDVVALTADHTQKLSSDPNHRINNPELGGGALLDLGIYPISFAWDIFGKPETVTATGTLGATGTDTQVQATFTYSGGRVASTFSSAIARGATAATIMGTEASMYIDPVWYGATSFRVVATDGTVLETYKSHIEGRGMQFQALAAEQLVAAGDLTGGLLPIAESVGIMQTLDEIRRQIGVVYPSDSGELVLH